MAARASTTATAAAAPTCTSPRTFAVWWFALLLVHVVAVAYFGFSALVYSLLRGTNLGMWLRSFDIGMNAKHYTAIARVMTLLALPHAVLILKMLAASLSSRSLAFTFSSRTARVTPAHTAKSESGSEAKHAGKSDSMHKQSATRKSSTISLKTTLCTRLLTGAKSWLQRLAAPYRSITSRDGLFGVDSQYFHAILFVREVVETSLQSVQAYRMSLYLPRVWLNRFFVVVLVLNCWLTPLVYFTFKRSETMKRLLCLVCDCALDFVASVVIPSVIFASYAGTLDLDLTGIEDVMWYDDFWHMNIHLELQMLLVTSWGDLATRVVFSFGMLVCMSDIKDLVEDTCYRSGTRVRPTTTASTIGPRGLTMTNKQPVPSAIPTAIAVRAATAVTSSPPRYRTKLLRRLSTAASTIMTPKPKFSGRASKLVHTAVFVWGAAVLALHIHAGSHPQLPQCLLQVRPWGKLEPACSLVLLNCYASGIRGSESQVDAQWSVIDPDVVERVIVRHCTGLEMPPVLQRFSRLLSLKVYNSTITSWSDTAALTSAHHPNLSWLFFARVNMSNGELPPGLLSPNFPTSVFSIPFCVTNLRTLPSDLDTKWPSQIGLYIENSALTEVPPALMRLQPMALSVFGNPITELPSAVFEIEGIILDIGNTLITSLPETVAAPSSTLTTLFMANTRVSHIPDWVDTFTNKAADEFFFTLYASGTPYCGQMNEILNGTRRAFSMRDGETSTTAPPLSMFMNATAVTEGLLHELVNCNDTSTAEPLSPLWLEDLISSLAA